VTKYEYCILERIKKGEISIDTDGHVWRHWDGRNNVKRKWLKIPREVKPRLWGRSSLYLNVALGCCGRSRKFRVHRLVWMAFHGEIPSDREINHKDGDKLNNHLSNLELVTTQQNALHAHRTGLMNPARGERVGSAKLTSGEVIEIRALYSSGEWSTRKLAPLFNVSYHQVWMIVTRKSWRHI